MDAQVAKQKNSRYMKRKLREVLIAKQRKFEDQLENTQEAFKGELKETPILKTHPADMNVQPVSINGKRIPTLQKCLVKIDQALIKVEQGTYGFCRSCHDPISIGRLQAVPFAELCVPCKNRKNNHPK